MLRLGLAALVLAESLSSNTKMTISYFEIDIDGGTATGGNLVTGTVSNTMSAAVGGSTDQVFQLNGQTVTTSYVVPTNMNAMSSGPITVNSGAVVTVPSGSVWTVV